MSPAAVYAQRLAALPRALSILELHPQGLPLVDLAEELQVTPQDLREVVMAYYLADLVGVDSFTLPVIEFFSPEADEEDGAADDADPGPGEAPVDALWVRVLTSDPEHELGVDHLSAGQVAALHEAAVDLLVLEPDNEVLAEAVDAFAAALGPPDAADAAGPGTGTAQALHQAVAEHRRVRVTYVRQWHPGTRERVIEPYRLVRTRRGWEVDAGPADDVAAVRTYLVSGIVAHELLAETFVPPDDLDALLAQNRAAQRVDLVVPQESRWAAERFAESVTVLDDDESDVSLRADLLPPVEQRLGLLLLCCGPTAFVTAPRHLTGAGERMARTLRAHHGQPPG